VLPKAQLSLEQESRPLMAAFVSGWRRRLELSGLDRRGRLLGRQQQVLVERIAKDCDLDPLSSTRDDRENRAAGVGHPHIVLQLGHMLFGGCFFREIPGQHELGFEHGSGLADSAVECRAHPFVDRVANPPLHVLDSIPGVALVPSPVQVLSNGAELDDEVLAQVFRFGLTPLLTPKPDLQSLFYPQVEAGHGIGRAAGVDLRHSSAVHRKGGVHGVVAGSNLNYAKSVSRSTSGVNT
jgi:hypothetical protein